MKPLIAQARAETLMTLRRGESVLLALGIPVGLLSFFSLVDVLPTPTRHPVDFLAPGILALAVMSTAMVSLAIATGFERQYGVLKRLGTTPLGRPALLAAKSISVLVVIALQVAVLVPMALVLGWRPHAAAPTALLAVVLGTVAFAGLGLLMAGRLRAEATLAGANGLYLALLLLGGMVIPITRLPGGLRAVSRGLPAGALSDALHAALGAGAAVPTRGVDRARRLGDRGPPRRRPHLPLGIVGPVETEDLPALDATGQAWLRERIAEYGSGRAPPRSMGARPQRRGRTGPAPARGSATCRPPRQGAASASVESELVELLRSRDPRWMTWRSVSCSAVGSPRLCGSDIASYDVRCRSDLGLRRCRGVPSLRADRFAHCDAKRTGNRPHMKRATPALMIECAVVVVKSLNRVRITTTTAHSIGSSASRRPL